MPVATSCTCTQFFRCVAAPPMSAPCPASYFAGPPIRVAPEERRPVIFPDKRLRCRPLDNWAGPWIIGREIGRGGRTPDPRRDFDLSSDRDLPACSNHDCDGDGFGGVPAAIQRRGLWQVLDHGIGIPARDRNRLFERYFPAANATAVAGTGVGLHLVAMVLSLHQGDVFAESLEGVGSRFIVHLPILA